jgi:hypothetical protein
MNTSSNNLNNKHKPKRIEKELLLLRNLPKEYKLGKRETPLGTLLYVTKYIPFILLLSWK